MTNDSQRHLTIWLIGGTSESAKIAKLLAKEQVPCTITVTTASAQNLYPLSPWLKVLVGRLDYSQISALLQQQIVAVVDASHPYAVEISQQAAEAAKQHHIPYLRYERPSSEIAEDTNVTRLDSFETLLLGDYLSGERVLLTVGYKALPLFQPWQNRSCLFARILPAVNSLEVAKQSGFTSLRLIALRPPISAPLEKALWHHWQISLVVTKASGKAGGEDLKRKIAAELGIPLIVIARPQIAYPRQTSDLSEVLAFTRVHIN